MLKYAMLLAGALSYLVYFKPMLEKRKANAEFDNLVLGVIDGLYLMGVPFRCPAVDMRSYVLRQLNAAHKLQSDQTLLNYKAVNGFQYRSLTASGDHTLFAVLCLVRYAAECGNQELLDWCESHLEPARQNGIGYYSKW